MINVLNMWLIKFVYGTRSGKKIKLGDQSVVKNDLENRPQREFKEI